VRHAALLAFLIWAILVLIVIHFPKINSNPTMHFDRNFPPTEHWSPPTQPEELEA